MGKPQSGSRRPKVRGSENRIPENSLLNRYRIYGSEVHRSYVRGKKPKRGDFVRIWIWGVGPAGFGKYLGDDRIRVNYKYNPASEAGESGFEKLKEPRIVTRRWFETLHVIELGTEKGTLRKGRE